MLLRPNSDLALVSHIGACQDAAKTSGDGSAGLDAGPGAAEDDARRWAQAEQRAAGVVVPDEWSVLRRFLLVELPLVLVGCMALAVVATLIWGDGRSWLGLALVVTALFCVFRHFRRRLRRDRHPLNSAHGAVLSWQQRKSIHRQVKGREPVELAHLAVVGLVARRERRDMMRSMPAVVGMELLLFGNAVSGWNRGWVSVYVVPAAIVGLVMLLGAVGQIRRTSAFLRRYPEPSSEAPSA
ncbi:hypothetical protein V6N00_03390 [Tersicoccus sp. MR15.9]|uniref:hypothetical protein n=1 Tax=Tersicoccus mangrovi TaxID=3121635 RepID=UPI002FE6ADD1